MTDRPILFRPEMIRALLAGTKTQTRRPAWRWRSMTQEEGAGNIRAPAAAQRINPGDRLWVREAHYVQSAGYKDGSGQIILYRASDPDAPTTWTPSIHMPRWVSRLTLAVTAVRIERLQEISANDAIAEGIDTCQTMATGRLTTVWWDYLTPRTGYQETPRGSYRTLYTSIHGNAAWNANPEVVVITFVVHKANIDAAERR